MTAPVAFGVGVAVGAVLVVLAAAVVLWLHIWRAERHSTRSSFPDLDGDPDITQPIPVLDRDGHPTHAPQRQEQRR